MQTVLLFQKSSVAILARFRMKTGLGMGFFDVRLSGSGVEMLKDCFDRNAALLALSAYAVTGMTADRDICTSLLVVRVFNLDDPLSELALSLQRRIATYFLPSLVLHRPYRCNSLFCFQ
jgi:hypothetical protein